MQSLAMSIRFVALALLLSGCTDGRSSAASGAVSATLGAGAPAQTSATGTTAMAADSDPLLPLAHESALPEALRAMIGTPFSGDLDEMEARRMIRVGVTFNRTHYFVDRGTQQ